VKIRRVGVLLARTRCPSYLHESIRIAIVNSLRDALLLSRRELTHEVGEGAVFLSSNPARRSGGNLSGQKGMSEILSLLVHVIVTGECEVPPKNSGKTSVSLVMRAFQRLCALNRFRGWNPIKLVDFPRTSHCPDCK
jgi:hypothetical protein